MSKTYAVIKNNTVVNVVLWDGESEWSPDNGIAIPAANGVGIGWLYADGNLTAPDIPEPVKSHDELVAEVESEKLARIDTATNRIIVWQTKLLMGRKLTNAESSSLNGWMDYIDAVAAIDASTAPDINWPAIPA
ncbi:tail fiber assembly protein [Klebsiella sp. WP3-W18-ESBL-02]|uniref:tail fiber assembly protein n=1 Tax=Klebsiella sp. WP3-W18-ESBL-02 TaxID=2675710 RepID=UPI0015DC336F|nr:tail fiber assembly protein [Klebsiella sp. WP3-W18-ESBL-02]BBQ83945.1 tail fiber assembly protein [Klebsiella sp. WP3-W18-ESBL-02]BBQ85280.1 tail fiber assembly protein [Klebsiella sp. WP3-W18-ESBL-02]